ncbi:MAG: hypothetical protein OEM95_07800, partial [Gammaproteobacteria bacterium]|nr:hypothetical protein [Gammaproteobacteria bacterium]
QLNFSPQLIEANNATTIIKSTGWSRLAYSNSDMKEEAELYISRDAIGKFVFAARLREGYLYT